VIDSRLQTVLDTVADGILFMDARGRVTMFNPACERMFGYAAADVVGGDVDRLMPSLDRGEHDRHLESYLPIRGGESAAPGREALGLRKNGDAFPLHLSIGKVAGDDEVAYVGILRDATERKRADDLVREKQNRADVLVREKQDRADVLVREEHDRADVLVREKHDRADELVREKHERADELRERFIEQLTASNEERTHFVHAASHDLREPLRMVVAFCGRLSKDYGDRLDARGAEYLSLAVAAAARMTRLLDDLVDFGRLGLAAARGSRFDAGLIVDQTIENFEEPIRESGATVTRGDLPRVYGNPIRFQRLMQNLIGNALKYVAEGVAPRIHVAARREGEFWVFSIADNGIGIEPRYYDRIFEPFKRLHSKSRYDGSGLGLAISRKIVEGFGGAISVRSTQAEGSIFTFTIKIEREDTDNVATDA